MEILPVKPPRNNFTLHEEAAETLFIAGGIGITLLWCMIQRLEELRRSWRLIYCAPTRKQMAFRARLEMLEQAKSGRVVFNFDHEPDGKILDLAAALAGMDCQLV